MWRLWLIEFPPNAFFFLYQLSRLGLDHLVGTPALKPYMHGYFLSLQLYDTARLIANPYVYEEHRERMVQEKMEKLAETRIRARKDPGANVKVNKALAEKIRKEEEREKKKLEKKKKAVTRKADPHTAENGDAMALDDAASSDEGGEEHGEEAEKTTLLNDPRFKDLFENPEFEVDEESREYALLHPPSVAQRHAPNGSGKKGRTKTAVEEEEDESDKVSSDGFSRSSESEDGESESEDSDAAGGT